MKTSIPAQQSTVTNSKKSGIKKTKAQAIALEPRYMFDGAAVTSAAEVTDHAEGFARDTSPAIGQIPSEKISVRLDPSSEAIKTTATRQEIVFIDTSIPDWQKLVDATRAEVQIVLLDPTQDALSQIAQHLAASQKLGQQFNSVHIVSHGNTGELIIGQNTYNAANLATRQNDLASIGRALTTDGDILLYGCDIAQGSSGDALLTAIAQATSADVTASTNTTGSKVHWSGDWELEKQTGAISTEFFAPAASLQQFEGKLATISLSGSSGWTAIMYGTGRDPEDRKKDGIRRGHPDQRGL